MIKANQKIFQGKRVELWTNNILFHVFGRKLIMSVYSSQPAFAL